MSFSGTAFRAAVLLLLLTVCCNISTQAAPTSVKQASDLIDIFTNAKGPTVDTELNIDADLNFTDSNLTLPLGAGADGSCVPYAGVLHGNGHSITGLVMGTSQDAGLFCALASATVTDLVIDASCAFTGNRTGALCAVATGTTTVRRTANRANVTGHSCVGGLIGGLVDVVEGRTDSSDSSADSSAHRYNSDSSDSSFYSTIYGRIHGAAATGVTLELDECVNEGSVDAAAAYAGGLVGRAGSTARVAVTVTNSTNLGAVRGTEHVGGLVGRVFVDGADAAAATARVVNSANRGSVNASSTPACGLLCAAVGDVAVQNSANMGAITATDGTAYGIANAVTQADNVVSFGSVDGKTAAFSFWETHMTEPTHLFGAKDDCKQCSSGTTMLEHDKATGRYKDSGTGGAVRSALSENGRKYGRVWTDTLFLASQTMNVSIGNPLKTDFDISQETPVQELEALCADTLGVAYVVDSGDTDKQPLTHSSQVAADSHILFCHQVSIQRPNDTVFVYAERYTMLHDSKAIDYSVGCYLLDSTSGKYIGFTTNVTGDMSLALGNQVSTTGATSISIFILSGKKLSEDDSLKFYLQKENYYRVVIKGTDTPLDMDYIVTSNIVLNITDLCGTLPQEECSNTTVCGWNKNNTCTRGGGKSTLNVAAVVGGVVAGVAVLIAVVVIVLFVVLRRNRGNRKLEVALAGTNLFQTGMGTNSSVTVNINGKDVVMQLSDELGRGSFATVWLAHTTEGDQSKEYAVKVVNGVFSKGAADAQREATMMEHLDTQFVVAVYGCGYTDRSMAIAMEYFALGSLQTVLQQDQLPSGSRVPMLFNIAKAMEYLHSQGIIHRDLKPGNVLVCSTDPRVYPMCKFVSTTVITHTHMFKLTTLDKTCLNTSQDLRLWRGTFGRVDGTEHDHDKRYWHTVLHGTRDGFEQQALHCRRRCVQLWYHGCSDHDWPPQVRARRCV